MDRRLAYFILQIHLEPVEQGQIPGHRQRDRLLSEINSLSIHLLHNRAYLLHTGQYHSLEDQLHRLRRFGSFIRWSENQLAGGVFQHQPPEL